MLGAAMSQQRLQEEGTGKVEVTLLPSKARNAKLVPKA